MDDELWMFESCFSFRPAIASTCRSGDELYAVDSLLVLATAKSAQFWSCPRSAMPSLARVVLLLPIALLSVSVAANAAECDTGKLAKALQPLKNEDDYWACHAKSIAGLTCSGASCKSLLAPLAALELPDCTATSTGGVFNPSKAKQATSALCALGPGLILEIKGVYAHRYLEFVLAFLDQHT
jgi:hypothetical protein